LIDVNPWTHHDEPWLATDWEYENLTGVPGYPAGTKMGVRFWLRDDIYWQDGTKFTVDDVKFAWDFLHDWALPNYWYFAKYIVDVDVDYDENSVTAFMSRTSQWDLYDLAGSAAMLPPQVWAEHPVENRPWASVTEIEGFDPAQSNPDPAVPTYLYGTGPVVFQFYDDSAAYGDVDANRNYWMSQAEITAKLEEYLWRSGDVDHGGKVYAADLAEIGLYWAQDAEECSVDSVSGGSWYRQPPTGGEPYLHRRCDAEYIYDDRDGQVSAEFGFTNPTHDPKGIDKVEVCIEVSRAPMDMGDSSWVWVEVYDGTTWHDGCDIGNIHVGKKDRCCDVTAILNTWAKLDAAKVRFTYNKGGAAVDPSVIKISYAYLKVYDFNFDADITGPLSAPPDGKIDTDDLVVSGKFFGETLTVPWP
jgi:hypothetical protein